VVQGFTGAVPDTVVQAAAPWHIYSDWYFSPGQYPLGDKGMLGVATKKARTNTLEPH